MSRGPGIWQRRILEQVAELPIDQACMLDGIIRHYETHPTPSHRASARRAVRRLAEDGKIKAGTEKLRGHGLWMLVARPDTTFEVRHSHLMDCPEWYSLLSPFDRAFESAARERFGDDTDGTEWYSPRERVGIAARREWWREELAVSGWRLGTAQCSGEGVGERTAVVHTETESVRG